MSFEDERDRCRRRKSEDQDGREASEDQLKKRRKRAPASEVGDALRSAYQRTLDEAIPPEMLDLLGKLG